jgi:methanogenic corrinoid protein MtbC1
MENVDDAASTLECKNVSGDVAARYAFLKVVSDLPHSGVPTKSTYDLTHTIESEIIPRLILAHRNNGERRATEHLSAARVMPSDLKEFFEVILVDRVDDALSLVVALTTRGVPVESIMLDLLAPTAAKLGAMWEEDNVDFLSVTISLGRLQQVLRHISRASQRALSAGTPSHKVLLSTVPGETHIFSLLLVDQFFRGGGWDAWTLPGASRDELIDLVSREDFALVGLSVSCSACVGELQQLIPAIRRAAKSKALRIMVGGPVFNGRPEFAIELGADGTACDGPTALIEARRIVENQTARS